MAFPKESHFTQETIKAQTQILLIAILRELLGLSENSTIFFSQVISVVH